MKDRPPSQQKKKHNYEETYEEDDDFEDDKGEDDKTQLSKIIKKTEMENKDAKNYMSQKKAEKEMLNSILNPNQNTSAPS